MSSPKRVLKSVVWTYKKFIEDEKIPKALTKGKLNEAFEAKFGKAVKNCVDYYYGVSIIEQKQFEQKTVMMMTRKNLPKRGDHPQ